MNKYQENYFTHHFGEDSANLSILRYKFTKM